MKFKLTFAIFLFVFSQIFSQTKLFESIKNENPDSLKIIGMYYNWDENKIYEKYNFYITDKKTIDSLISNIYYHESTKNIFEHNNFSIIVTKNNQILDRWSVSPKFENINIKGQSHKFDISILGKLAKKFPFKYNWYKQEFKNREDFEKFYSSKINEKSTLFIYKPNFIYDGSFEIQFSKNETFIHPKAIDEYLRPKLEKIAKDEKFSISYILTEFNMKNRDQYTMTVSGSKNLFNKLKEKQGIKGNWTPTKLEAQIFEKIE
ncbi:hypothetical protein [Chryseobacterium chendengshani]|uniref:hypothetical protein n=1 Tax=Chryseobacterium sp. LJ756 TaxID=2864113 RepID=UPI001C63C7C6|nr:hypothetical protein [Chryseobacterium sp. LJ756]MBW7675879.1 hypothetical protein [Chryseobacterium sp. LJ756]